MLDAIIVGGGPAGLSAALVLARCRRRVIVFDDGHPRNKPSLHSHNFLTRDGVPPGELLRLGREELIGYGVEIVQSRVVEARCCSPTPAPGRPSAVRRTAFEVTLANGQSFRGRKLLLATGLRDVLPDIDGFERFYGKGVHHCPYCDAYEYADQPLVTFGDGSHAVGAAIGLLTWSNDVTICSNGSTLDDEQRRRIAANGLKLRDERIVRLEGGERLERVVFDGGEALPCAALFFNTSQTQQSELPRMLGCEYDPEGKIVTRAKQHTCVSGLYLAGDADGDVQFLVVAAAEGATAACAINRDLQDKDCGEAEPIEDAWRFRDDERTTGSEAGPA